MSLSKRESSLEEGTILFTYVWCFFHSSFITLLKFRQYVLVLAFHMSPKFMKPVKNADQTILNNVARSSN